jgi:hypothetical protein
MVGGLVAGGGARGGLEARDGGGCVRLPVDDTVTCRTSGEVIDPRPISVDSEDLKVFDPLAVEGNLLAIGGEGRSFVEYLIMGAAGLIRAVDAHDEDLKVAVPVAHKGYPAVLAREGRLGRFGAHSPDDDYHRGHESQHHGPYGRYPAAQNTAYYLVTSSQ